VHLLLPFVVIVLAQPTAQGPQDGEREWVERTNREAGGLELGLKARWPPRPSGA